MLLIRQLLKCYNENENFNKKIPNSNVYLGNSNIKIPNSKLIRVIFCHDSSDSEQAKQFTNFYSQRLSKIIREFVAEKTAKKIPNPNRKIGIWNFYIEILKLLPYKVDDFPRNNNHFIWRSAI